MTKPCKITDCDADAQCKGMCWHHFNRFRTYGDPLAPLKNFRDPAQAILHRTDRTVRGPEGLPGNCWIWTGGNNGTYGTLSAGLAHRVSYELTKGQIPDGLEIDHLCRRPLCVNPEHLEAVTRRVNLLRSTNFVALQAAQTECIAGHPLSGPNLYVDPRGRRQCRECRRRRSQEAQVRKEAAAGKPSTSIVIHGASRYRNHGCRCDICRAGNTQRKRDAAARRAQSPEAADQAGHGKQSTYRNTGCRCDPCKVANRDAVRAARARQKVVAP